jgi:hypothetical protein
MNTLNADAAATLLEQVAFIAKNAPSKHQQGMSDVEDALKGVIRTILASKVEQMAFQASLATLSVNPPNSFTAAQAATLVRQVADIFYAIPDGDDKRRIATGLDTLIEVIKDRFAQISNGDWSMFDRFVRELAASDRADALRYELSVTLPVNPARCLNNGHTVPCDRPPQRYNICDLCKRSGTQ